jgi:CPA2 family monovalent cation:H+ antiporter-2
MFLMAVLAVVLGTAYASYSAGLSLALGAFVAGLVLAESDYAQRALGDLLPLRDILTSLFFISIGMLFNSRAVVADPLLVAGLLVAIIFGKGFIATLAAIFLRFPARVAWLTGVGLAQFGEFGFVLLGLARANGLITTGEFDTVLAGGILSMFLTPLLIALAPRVHVGAKLLGPLEKLLGVEAIDAPQPGEAPRCDHVVIVGFGPAGQLLARILRRYEHPYLVLDLNVRTVRRMREDGEPIHYGDIGSTETMFHAGLGQARALVIMVNDPPSADRAISAARHEYPDLPIIVRARFVTDRDHLLRIGATEVITEELEAGKSMVTTTLERLGIDRRTATQALRMDAQQLLAEARGRRDSS